MFSSFFGVQHHSPSANSSGFLMWITLDRILLLFFLVDQLLSLSAFAGSCKTSSKIKSAFRDGLWVA